MVTVVASPRAINLLEKLLKLLRGIWIDCEHACQVIVSGTSYVGKAFAVIFVEVFA